MSELSNVTLEFLRDTLKTHFTRNAEMNKRNVENGWRDAELRIQEMMLKQATAIATLEREIRERDAARNDFEMLKGR